MHNHPSAVPDICILGADDPSALFDSGDALPPDLDLYLQDPAIYACPQGLYPDLPMPELEEFSYLATTNQPCLTGHGFALPYAILRERASPDGGLSLGSPILSPTPSIGSSLSPGSFYDPVPPSDSDSLLSTSPDTADGYCLWSSHPLSTESLPPFNHGLFSPPTFPHHGPGPHRARSKSSPTRSGPVASKAMLEANGRRRRHPAQFECRECKQTFTALFSLKRHLQSHTGERPFACSVPGCMQRFYNSSDCKRHEKSKKRHKDL